MAEPASIPVFFLYFLSPTFSLQSLGAQKRFFFSFFPAYSWESKPQMLSCMIKSLTLQYGCHLNFCRADGKLNLCIVRAHVVNEYSLPFSSSFTDMCSGEAAAVNVVFSEGFNKRWDV